MSWVDRCPECLTPEVEAFPCRRCGYDGSNQESAHHLKTGTVLKDRYYIGKVLGQGGFGITYLGWDLVLDVKIAIKEYFPLSLVVRNPETMEISCADSQAREDFEYGLEKFLGEARILASFSDSPNIVSTKDFFKEYGAAYMAMEYIDGVDLKCYLDRHGGLMPWEQARGVVMHVIDALKDVHGKGLLHRDISPDNIFITTRGQIKLLDFGAARFAFGMQNKSLSVVLKPGYAPIEQYQTKGHQGPWTDVYSLGATLYRCIAGHLPPESLDRLETDSLAPLSKFGISVPDYFEQALARALAVKSADRFQSVQDFQNALNGQGQENAAIEQAPAENRVHAQGVGRDAVRDAASSAYAPPPPISPQDPSKPVQKKQKSSGKAVKIAFGSLALLLLAWGGFVWVGASRDTPRRIDVAAPGKNEKNVQVSPAATSDAPKADRNAAGEATVKADLARAEELFGQAGRVAMGLDGAPDMARAQSLYKEAANLGHVGAMTSLGAMYEFGNGVEANVREAALWYEKSALAGGEEACLSLGRMIYEGRSMPQDLGHTVALLNKMADREDVEALYILGRIYETGSGRMPKDLRKAKQYLREPAKQGYLDAKARLDAIERN